MALLGAREGHARLAIGGSNWLAKLSPELQDKLSPKLQIRFLPPTLSTCAVAAG